MSGLRAVTSLMKQTGNGILNYGLKRPLAALAQAPGMDTVCKWHQDKKSFQKYINGIGVFSIVAKDAYGCYLYVKQSLSNQKIPEDKRKFVAALDLANGGLMMVMQLLIFFTVSRPSLQKKMFNKTFGKFFNRSATKSYQALMKQEENFKNMSSKKFHKAVGKQKDDAASGFSYITSFVAATIIGKRIIVPFIATPLADKTKAWMCRNDKPVEIDKDTKNTYDKFTPAAEKTNPKGSNTKLKDVSTNMLSKFKNKQEVS